MGETDISDFVDVPGDTTLWKTQDIPPTRIKLPVEARGRFCWQYPILGLASVWTLSSSVGFYSVAAQNWGSGNSLDRIGWLAGIIGCLFVGVLFAGMFVRTVSDAVGGRPLLILTGEALWDRRQLHAPLPWHTIKSIKFQSSRGTLLVRLHLERPIYVKNGIFRLGGALRSGLKSEVQVLISSLDQNDEKIAKVLAALVRKNGGEIEGYSAYASYQPMNPS